MIGEFVARYDDPAEGVMMDADTAQALARAFQKLKDERLEKERSSSAGGEVKREPLPGRKGLAAVLLSSRRMLCRRHW